MGTAMVPVERNPRRPVRQRRPNHSRAAFSLAEALVALTILGLAGSALLLATDAALQSSADSFDQAIAAGLAHQVIDEAMGLGYVEKGNSPLQVPMGPEAGETSLPRKTSLFDDTDDFFGYLAFPPTDPWAQPLGRGDGQGNLRHPNFRLPANRFNDWGVAVWVWYVDENNPGVNQGWFTATGMRAIEARVYKRDGQGNYRMLNVVRRVFGHVPAPS